MTTTKRLFYGGGLSLIRSILIFGTGLIQARFLGPNLMGEFTALMAIGIGVRQALDLGFSSAVMTFASKYPDDQGYTDFYMWWSSGLVLASIGISYCISFFPVFHFSDDNVAVLLMLACISAFAQHQFWGGVIAICEQERQTILHSFFSVIIVILILIVSLILINVSRFSIANIFMGNIFIWGSGALAIFFYFKVMRIDRESKYHRIEILRDYLKFAKPFSVYVFLSAVVELLDRNVLANAASAEELGYFAAAFQISLFGGALATAISKPLWREITQHWSNNDTDQIKNIGINFVGPIYHLLLLFALFVAPLLSQVILVVLGSEYVPAVYSLYFCLLWTAQQFLFQLISVIFLACEASKTYVFINSLVMITGIFGAGFLAISGLLSYEIDGLGASVLMLKMLIIQFLANMIALSYINHKLDIDLRGVFRWKTTSVVCLLVLGVAYGRLYDFTPYYLISAYGVCALILSWAFLVSHKEQLKFFLGSISRKFS